MSSPVQSSGEDINEGHQRKQKTHGFAFWKLVFFKFETYANNKTEKK